MTVNIMLIITIAIFLICAISGIHAGLLRKVSGILSFILAGAIASAILPAVTDALRDSTPIYGMLQDQCAKVGENLIKNTLSQAPLVASSGNENAFDNLYNADGSVNRDFVRSLLQQYGYDGSVIDGMTDDQIRSYISQYAGVSAGAANPAGVLWGRERAFDASLYTDMRAPRRSGSVSVLLPVLATRLPAMTDTVLAQLTADVPENSDQNDGNPTNSPASASGGSSAGTSADSSAGTDRAAGSLYSQDILNLVSNLTVSDQRKFIESLPIPPSLQEQMETFNNGEGYQKLGVTDFASYVTSYFASLIFNLICYFVSLLLAWLILKAVFGALGIFTRLPIFGAVDRIGGLAVGLIQALLIVWILFTILSFLSATPFGRVLMTQVYDSPFLETLYNTNFFVKSASGAMRGIL